MLGKQTRESEFRRSADAALGDQAGHQARGRDVEGIIRHRAVVGMVMGFATTIVWIVQFKADNYDLYEMIPGFFVGLAVIWVVSLLTQEPRSQ